MKHTIEQLQFAATVRQLAITLRNSQIKPDMTDEQAMAIKSQPLNAHVVSALRELHDMADFINSVTLME